MAGGPLIILWLITIVCAVDARALRRNFGHLVGSNPCAKVFFRSTRKLIHLY